MQKNIDITGILKYHVKRFLVLVHLQHPSLGIKIDAKEKVSTLLQHKTKDIKIFVETGTSEGDTIADLANHFQKIYSIELNHNLYTKAVGRFSSRTNIELLEGDSSIEIKKVLLGLKEPALFWLDAHAPGTITPSNSPIIGELESIFALMVKGGVILIDDARHFDRKTIRKIKKIAKTNDYNFVIENGIFRLNEK
ncbi:hypothetical protein COU54_04810 [Candidatus Pacearchaeota archaeon CG10_big_fil_rev_8_21_14_0_10_31_24]|nr:MAG: hypothetical protein COU54_04810 [Candidatus Pacearchaeota archaeon CG10_big_fil_rev_8_21_14_0_10_31_24]